MSWYNFVNTRYFSEASIDYKKNGGRYTDAPRGSRDYFEYWEEQDRRCAKGYSVGGVWIPGRMYFYLNFFPMWKVDDKIALKALEERRNGHGLLSKLTADKILDFPRFTEMQYEWWNLKHIAWNGGKFMGIKSPGGRHMCCLKTRGAGFSYMEAADGIYNYNFIDGSKSYYFASREQYLTTDGILNKVQEGLDWINSSSPYWKKNRQKRNVLMHQKASYINDYNIEEGSMSEIIGVTVDDANKVRGKRGRKITFEEAGSFPNLKQALEISMGSLRDGELYVGQMSVFGTGGEEGPSIEGLEDVFSNPEQWDMLPVPDLFGGSNDMVGYFVPCYRANFIYHDIDGNCDIELAIASDNKERDKKKKSKDPKALDRRKAEYPRTPNEALQRLNNNGFNIAEIDAQIKRLETSKALQGYLRYGNLTYSSTGDALNGVEFNIMSKEDANPIEVYPHTSKNSEHVDLSGCVTVCERPFIAQDGKVPYKMYQIVFDPYYKDDAEDVTSLFAIYVFKQDNNIDPSYNGLPVAWYVGRPKKLDSCYDTLFKLAKYYNTTVQGEISGGGQGVIDYAKTRRLLHLVEFEPEMMHNKELASKQKNRSYLMNMNTERKRLGMSYLEDWHMEQRGIDSLGNPILTVHRIYDIALLREMRKSSPTNNTDRLSAVLIYMFMRKENITQQLAARTSTSDFFKRNLFGAQGSSSDNHSGGFVSLY